jgi:hypothetical protein
MRWESFDIKDPMTFMTLDDETFHFIYYKHEAPRRILYL